MQGRRSASSRAFDLSLHQLEDLTRLAFMPSYTKKVEIPGKTADQLYEVVSQEIEKFLGKLSVGKLDVSHDPGARSVSAKSSMFTAKLTCEDDALRLDAQLSLFAAPFRSKIDEGIDRWVAKTFFPQA